MNDGPVIHKVIQQNACRKVWHRQAHFKWFALRQRRAGIEKDNGHRVYGRSRPASYRPKDIKDRAIRSVEPRYVPHHRCIR